MNPDEKPQVGALNLDISLDKNREIDPEKYRFKLKRRQSQMTNTTQVALNE